MGLLATRATNFDVALKRSVQEVRRVALSIDAVIAVLPEARHFIKTPYEALSKIVDDGYIFKFHEPYYETLADLTSTLYELTWFAEPLDHHCWAVIVSECDKILAICQKLIHR